VHYRVAPGKLLDLALTLLLEEGLITVEHDDFGPPLIVPCENFSTVFFTERAPENAVYRRYVRVGRTKDGWLREALDKLSIEQDYLGIQDSDFDNPESEWEPIPLDRDNPLLTDAVSKVDETIEQVRSPLGPIGFHRPQPHALKFHPRLGPPLWEMPLQCRAKPFISPRLLTSVLGPPRPIRI
jgi:hypothetical protein